MCVCCSALDTAVKGDEADVTSLLYQGCIEHTQQKKVTNACSSPSDRLQRRPSLVRVFLPYDVRGAVIGKVPCRRPSTHTLLRAVVIDAIILLTRNARDEVRKRHEDQGIPFFEVMCG